MNRRTLLKASGGLAAGLFITRGTNAFAQGSSTPDGDFPSLTITVYDDRYDIPDGLTAGRYAVSVVNAGTSGSHSSMGRLPEGVTTDQVIADMSQESDTLPDWFMNAGYVGLPDWGAPGETRTGVVDLEAGTYFMFDPFSDRHAFATVADGAISEVEPRSDLTVEATEMRFVFPNGALSAGPATVKVANIGAIAHEMQIVAVPEGTTIDQMKELFSLPFDATPPPGNELAKILVDYHPAAAASILAAGHTCWLDIDLQPGTYAVLCALPFPGDEPHAMEGMLDIVTVS